MSIKVLIVDDVVENRKMIASFLSSEPRYKIQMAKSGNDLLTAIDKNNIDIPDIILMDILMPGISGFDTVHELKNRNQTKHIPIIFITALSETNDIVKAFDVGGADYITKPFRKAELLARVKTHANLKFMNDKLTERNNELEKLNEEKNKFLGMAAHDLRNPLSLILQYSEVIKLESKNVLHDRQMAMLGKIKDTSEFMDEIISDFLTISKIESSSFELRKTDSDISPIVANIVEDLRVIGNRKNISICYKRPNETRNACLDVNKITQVIINLITNAFKFSHLNTQVEVSTMFNSSNVIIAVKDQGQGISKDDLDKIFVPFSSTRTKPTAGEKSTGLGLAISKKVVDAHNGELYVDSEVGVGSTFFVKIPLK